MIAIILILLIVLFALGYLPIPYFAIHDITLFNLLGRTISLYDLLLFLLIIWIIEALPWPFRGIASIVLVLWLLSFFGIFVIAGFSNILTILLIIGLIAYIFKGFK